MKWTRAEQKAYGSARRQRQWRKAHPEAQAAAHACAKTWRKENPERAKKSGVAWRKAHPQECRAMWLWSRYRIEAIEQQRMMTDQNQRCKLCRAPFTTFKSNRASSPCIEHGHQCSNRTNHGVKGPNGGCAKCIRGIVCQRCNSVVVRFLELYPDRQTVAEREYMADRPILRYRVEAGL